MHLRHSQSSRVSLPVGVTPALAAQDPSVPVPYTIKDHKIGGRSIRVRVDGIPALPSVAAKEFRFLAGLRQERVSGMDVRV